MESIERLVSFKLIHAEHPRIQLKNILLNLVVEGFIVEEVGIDYIELKDSIIIEFIENSIFIVDLKNLSRQVEFFIGVDYV